MLHNAEIIRAGKQPASRNTCYLSLSDLQMLSMYILSIVPLNTKNNENVDDDW